MIRRIVLASALLLAAPALAQQAVIDPRLAAETINLLRAEVQYDEGALKVANTDKLQREKDWSTYIIGCVKDEKWLCDWPDKTPATETSPAK